jgi:hypothetical protein
MLRVLGVSLPLLLLPLLLLLTLAAPIVAAVSNSNNSNDHGGGGCSLNLYVSEDAGADQNNGLSVAAPFAHVRSALNVVRAGTCLHVYANADVSRDGMRAVPRAYTGVVNWNFRIVDDNVAVLGAGVHPAVLATIQSAAVRADAARWKTWIDLQAHPDAAAFILDNSFPPRPGVSARNASIERFVVSNGEFTDNGGQPVKFAAIQVGAVVGILFVLLAILLLLCFFPRALSLSISLSLYLSLSLTHVHTRAHAQQNAKPTPTTTTYKR